MIKGFYNENEFYTNNYWDTKFFNELKNFNDQKIRIRTDFILGSSQVGIRIFRKGQKVEYYEKVFRWRRLEAHHDDDSPSSRRQRTRRI